MRKFDTVAIVGVGLIGGSIGLSIRQRSLARRIVGVGRRAASLRVAARHGTIDEATTDLARGVADAELVVVATPVESIADVVCRAAAAANPDCLLTDAGSIKAPIVTELARRLPSGARFVGSHPLAGSENAGPQHARADLFAGRTVILTPTRRTPTADTAELREFWAALGAEVRVMSPREHDRAVAATSHVPHLAAAAIAEATPERYLPLVATGWLDTTRIAAGDPELWRQILAGNRSQVLQALKRLETRIAAFRQALESPDTARLAKLLSEAKRKRDALGS